MCSLDMREKLMFANKAAKKKRELCDGGSMIGSLRFRSVQLCSSICHHSSIAHVQWIGASTIQARSSASSYTQRMHTKRSSLVYRYQLAFASQTNKTNVVRSGSNSMSAHDDLKQILRSHKSYFEHHKPHKLYLL